MRIAASKGVLIGGGVAVVGVVAAVFFLGLLEDEPTPGPPPGPAKPQAVAKPADKPADPAPTSAPAPAAKPPDAPNAPPTKKDDEPPARPVTKTPLIAQSCNAGKGMRLSQELDLDLGPREGTVRVQIVRPKPNEVIQSSQVSIGVHLTDFQAWKTNTAGGPHLRVLLDNEEARDWYDPDEEPLVIEGLATGLHTIRVFPVTAWGECVKGFAAFDAVNFYTRSDRDQPPPVDFSKPTLSFNVPQGAVKDMAAHRVLVDFHVANAEIGPAAYRVRMVLDGGTPIDLVAWTPVWLESLKPGDHTVALALFDAAGNPAPGPYNQVERTFKVDRER